MANTEKFQSEVTQKASYDDSKFHNLVKRMQVALVSKKLCFMNMKNAIDHHSAERLSAWFKKYQKADAEFVAAQSEVEQLLAKEGC